MPPERSPAPPRRIAVIGAGISGLGAAHFLAPAHRVVLIEAERRLGGHARTVIAGRRGDQPVDTGFIVFNEVNYPELTRLFRSLGVPTAKSDMSFGASFAGGRLEYGLRNLRAVFAQPANLLRPRFLGMLRDVLRFNATALAAATDPSETVGGLIRRLGLGDWFRDRYLLPLSGAIWSTPPERILDFPAQAMIRFFRNHALLSATGQHQWFTVRGGSVEYVRRLAASLVAAGVEIHTGAPVAAVRRVPGGAELRLRGGLWERFDEVVFATHSDEALALIADPAPEERAALAAVRYQPNRAVLHADPALMPRRRAVWSSWNYTEGPEGPGERIALTYWMNSLQPIAKDDPLFVTLNGTRPIRAELVYDEVTFRHPVYDLAALAAQDRIRGFNGARHTWFCGAWMRNGFHEDGLASAAEVAAGIARPAQVRRAAA
jgi:predicted NAD/FAD-binding protein